MCSLITITGGKIVKQTEDSVLEFVLSLECVLLSGGKIVKQTEDYMRCEFRSQSLPGQVDAFGILCVYCICIMCMITHTLTHIHTHTHTYIHNTHTLQ